MRLKTVVLPAPFGPISAVTLPCGTAKDTWSTARSPPKDLVRPTTSRAAALTAPLHVLAQRRDRRASGREAGEGAGPAGKGGGLTPQKCRREDNARPERAWHP